MVPTFCHALQLALQLLHQLRPLVHRRLVKAVQQLLPVSLGLGQQLTEPLVALHQLRSLLLPLQTAKVLSCLCQRI